ncbi:uncharacterized protein EHS24_002362 [Apiotrichum porosum]|uniref:Uncharacterized protein n=1 Tax=Apiotrichum porosum TaxID=105984 RepID=A0A427XIL2_9TREE|nr:uncharacterized protein EHS24_002362 [Apiotrichum porosum]RSH78633.1 hypothetical protein EHS24_002362 [Apiotrichum porosum]
MAHLAVLALYTQLLTYAIQFLHVDTSDTVHKWASYSVAIAAILFTVKLLDERPSATRRRKRAAVWARVQALVRDGLRIDTPSKTTTVPAPLPDADRTEELLGVLASFPVALQHHLLGTRALPHPPLCDLLPAGYLTSLKRTEARVRFAAVHAGPSGSGSPQKPTIDGARLHANGLSSSSSSPNGNGTSNGNGNGKAPNSDDEGGDDDKSLVAPLTPSKKSNLHTPHPSNMPLALLRLLEAYIMGFVELPTDRGGWTALQGNRALDVVKGLNACLSEAEGVYADPQPMITVRLCLNVFLFVLPLWLVCLLRGWLAIFATVIVGALAKFVLEAVLSEPEATSSNHPLHKATVAMVHESLDTCPALARYYRRRLIARLGGDSHEVVELDRRIRRRDEWLPTFT